ncbi:MAG: hypothetical protein Ta2A_08720 [Treponemataceae bacterium]|nr:MAG: hypothetical protein Ta2A_08720 [Treponemataceae bacterium]
MDNDHKIEFPLNLPTASGEKTALVYNIEAEYAQTVKNRSWFVVFLIGGLFLAIAAGVGIGHYAINKSIHSVAVDIEAFADINLKNLLDRVVRIQTQYDTAVNAKADLERKRDDDMRLLDITAADDKAGVRALGLGANEEKSRLAQIDRKLANDKAALEKTYRKEVAGLDAEIADYGEQIASFDQDKIREAQEKQSIINAELTRFELEKDQLRMQYEAQIDSLYARISSTQQTFQRSQTARANEATGSYSKHIEALNAAIDANIADYERMKADYNAIVAGRDAARSESTALAAERDAIRAERNTLTADRDATRAALRRNEALLERYMSFFRTVAGQNGDAGYIVDTRQSGMLVYVDPVYGTSFNGKKAFVWRSSNDYIGSISLTGSSGEIQAQIIEQAPGRSFQANDRILLDMAQ